MRVSVVLCAHTMDRWDAVTDAAESILAQTYDDVELVFVSDGAPDVYERFDDAYGDREAVVTHLGEQNRGLLAVRNRGGEIASGDVVAFIDDDAVADPEWVQHLVDAYQTSNAIAAGGKMVPEWVADRPEFLPEEFYWLIGVTHRGVPDEAGEVRNTNGSNISFRRDVFQDLGGFEVDIGGRKGDNHLQGGETELCARMRDEYDQGVYYVPEAVVAHKVFEYRTEPRWLLERAFWQGYSKRGMQQFTPESAGEEVSFLGDLLGRFLPRRLAGLVTGPSATKAKQLVWIVLLTGTVGMGYLYGIVKWG